MTLKQQITAWLDQPGADYSLGLDLFQQAGGRGIILRTLQLGEDAYNRTRLENEFSKWLTTQPTDKPNMVLAVDAVGSSLRFRKVVDDSSDIVPPTPLIVSMDYGASDEVYLVNSPTADQLKEKAWELMNQRSELKAYIRAHKDDPTRQPDRKDWAFAILEITDQIDAIYDKLDFLGEYGYLPSDEEPPVEPELDDLALLKNVRTYVSRYRGKLRKANLTAEQLDNFTTLLQQYEAEKARLELKLKANEI